MRHHYKGTNLGRNSAHKKALLQNLSISLFENEIICTTLTRAKELRSFAEPLITLAKNNTVANQRLAFSRLRNKAAVGKLFGELSERYQQRPGGYLRVLKCGYREGDNAPMAYVELVDRPEFEEVEE